MRKLETSKVTERIVGFSLPDDGKMFVCDHDEVYELDLSANVAKVTKLDPYEFMKNFRMLGITDEQPIKETKGNTISYDFRPTLNHVIVNLKIFDRSTTINFPIFSGDWFVGSFSRCGSYLVLAEPYEIAVYELK